MVLLKIREHSWVVSPIIIIIISVGGSKALRKSSVNRPTEQTIWCLDTDVQTNASRDRKSNSLPEHQRHSLSIINYKKYKCKGLKIHKKIFRAICIRRRKKDRPLPSWIDVTAGEVKSSWISTSDSDKCSLSDFDFTRIRALAISISQTSTLPRVLCATNIYGEFPNVGHVFEKIFRWTFRLRTWYLVR